MKQNYKEQTVQFQHFSYFHLVLVQQWLITPRGTPDLRNLMAAPSPSPQTFTKAACGAHVKMLRILPWEEVKTEPVGA